jgi:hypothetical protein
MLQGVDDLRQFLGPDLKAVTGDSSVIDEVALMVQVGGARGVQAGREHEAVWVVTMQHCTVSSVAR